MVSSFPRWQNDPCPPSLAQALAFWQGRETKEASSRGGWETEECQVPTSVWNDQLTGQGQRDDRVLVDQGRERSCGEGDGMSEQLSWKWAGAPREPTMPP